MDLYITNGYPIPQNNQLYMNNGDETFNKITDDDAINETGLYWNAVSGDYDNDGDLDIFAANYQGQNRLYNNNGLGAFTKITEGAIVNAYTVSEIGAAIWFDYNSDGFLDLFMANDIANNDVFRNEGNDNHWLELILRGTESNVSAIGARIKIKAVIAGMPVWQTRDVTSIVGFRSANHMQHFGLGDAITIDSLLVLWPSGQLTIQTDIPSDQILSVTEDVRPGFLRASFQADTFSGDQTLTVHFIDTSVANSNEPVTEWAWDFDNDGSIDSKEKNPTWTYSSEIPLQYTVSLTVINGLDTSATIRKNYIRLKGKTEWFSIGTNRTILYRYIPTPG